MLGRESLSLYNGANIFSSIRHAKHASGEDLLVEGSGPGIQQLLSHLLGQKIFPTKEVFLAMFFILTKHDFSTHLLSDFLSSGLEVIILNVTQFHPF
jgi:hypothetical protein